MAESKREVTIIGAALDLGQGRRGVDMGPSAIRYAGLEERLVGLGYTVRDEGNVETAVADYDLEYPVVQDNEYGTWDAYRNQYWPAKYLIDKQGQFVAFFPSDVTPESRLLRDAIAKALAAR